VVDVRDWLGVLNADWWMDQRSLIGAVLCWGRNLQGSKKWTKVLWVLVPFSSLWQVETALVKPYKNSHRLNIVLRELLMCTSLLAC